MPARSRARHRSPAPVTQSLRRLGERLRKARADAGLSQSQLGAPHFTRAYVSALELGKIRPAMKSLEFLAGKLGKPISHFLEDEEQERKRQERELALARAGQLIAEGESRRAVEELLAVDQEGISASERLALKRSLGRAYLEAGDGGKAAATLADAVRGYEALGDEELLARARGQLGAALIAVMSFGEAEVHLSAALKASAAGVVRDPLFRVHTLHNLGITFYQRGDYRGALEQFERAAAEGADIADQKWLASLYAAMGMSRRQVGDYEAAITWLRKSETLFEAIHNRSRVAEIRFQTARTLRAIGSKEKAASMLAEALSAAVSAGNEVLAIRIEALGGLIDAEEGRADQAIKRLEHLVDRADSGGDRGARFTARFALAKVLADAEPSRAEAVLRETAAVLEGTTAPDDLADVYDELGRVLARQGRSEEALEYAQRAYRTSRRS